MTSEIALQIAVVASVWAAMAFFAPAFFAVMYLPGCLGGLALCAIHGHYEHAGDTISHYGRLYNALCFNDGYHVEHHRHPSAPWWTLPRYRDEASRTSAWPAPLRWLEITNVLAGLERIVLRWPCLQRWVVGTPARAFQKLLAGEAPRNVAIVGGGLFPRTALVLRRLLPHARLTIVDANQANLERARAYLGDDEGVAFVRARFKSEINLNSELCSLNCQLLVFPLAFDGERAALYAKPPGAMVVVHDWIWHKHGTSRIVSPLLLKRINLVRA